jgi:hypothetical protein
MVKPEPLSLLTAGSSLTREPREVVKTKQRRKYTHRRKKMGENEIENVGGKRKEKD